MTYLVAKLQNCLINGCSEVLQFIVFSVFTVEQQLLLYSLLKIYQSFLELGWKKWFPNFIPNGYLYLG